MKTYSLQMPEDGWISENLEPRGNGRITMSRPSNRLRVEVEGGYTLHVWLMSVKGGMWRATEYDEPSPHSAIVLEEAVLQDENGDWDRRVEYSQITFEGYTQVHPGILVRSEDLLWITASEAQTRFGVAPATIRQAINREVEATGAAPTWARKSGKVWLVYEPECAARWGEKE